MIEITPTQACFEIRFEYRPQIVQAIKAIKGANFNALNPKDKHWQVPLTKKEDLFKLSKFFGVRWKVEMQRLKIPELPELQITLPLQTKPFKYQEKGIAAGLQWQRFINGDEPGLGKSFEAIGTAIAAQCKCILVVCPTTLKLNWRNEWKQHANRNAMLLEDSIKASWYRYYTTGICNIFIVNYESLKKYFVDELNKNEHGNYDSKHIIFKDTINMFDCIIFDEAHKLRNTHTLQYLLCNGLAYNKRFIMCLTGTPIVNKATDILALLKLTGKLNAFGGYKYFMNHYCNGDPANLVELNQMLYNTCFFRRLKKDVLTDLPDKTYQMVHCDITNRQEYQAAQRDLETYLRQWKGAKEYEVERSMRAEALVKLMKLRGIAARGKIEMAAEIIEETIESNQKIVVFVHQREVALELLKIFPHAVTVRGDDNNELRQRNVDAFQKEDNCNIIIVSIKAGGTGLTLTAAYNGLFVEWPWHPTDVDQCADRIHRIGQKNAALLRFLTGRNTIDEKLYKIIEMKRAISNTILGNEDGFNREVLDMVADSLFNNQTVTI